MFNKIKTVYRKVKFKFGNYDATKESTIDFGKFKLIVNMSDRGGATYAQKHYWSELYCPIHIEIVNKFQPTIFLDIGANYGFTSLVHYALNPSSKIVSVEPSPKVFSYLEKNLKYNGCINYVSINAICSDNESDSHSFSINPLSSQDNRVIGQSGWSTVNIPSVSINSLLNNTNENDYVFIKVDTQGFEERVFCGGEDFFSKNTKWLVKTEFAPWWLVSQGSNPINFLEYLIDNYKVVELPKRTRFKGDNLESLLRSSIEKRECANFVNYIQSLAQDIGWCDLLIFPKNFTI